MIEVAVPQDLREFEPTLLGFLTTRQVVCGSLGLIGVYGFYALEKSFGIEDPMSLPLFVLPAIPAGLIGWFRPYGIKFEKFIASAFISNYIAPTNRIYKVDNFFNQIEKEMIYGDMDEEAIKKRKAEEEKAKKKKKKKVARYKIPQEFRSYK